jgi:hypothetical protein
MALNALRIQHLLWFGSLVKIDVDGVCQALFFQRLLIPAHAKGFRRLVRRTTSRTLSLDRALVVRQLARRSTRHFSL